MRSTQNNSRTQTGFSVAEILVVAPIVLLTIATFIGIIVYLTGEVLVARGSNQLAFDTQSGLDMVEQDIRLSGGFLAENNFTPTSPQGYNSTAAKFSNVSTVQGTSLVLNMISTSGGSSRTNSKPTWLKDDPNACASTNVSQNKVMTYNVIYFVQNNTLWRRTIMPTGYATKGCSTPDQLPSCTTVAATPTNPCLTLDTRVLSDISALSIEYFGTANSTIPVTNATNTGSSAAVRQASLSATTTAKVTLSSAKTLAGKEVTYSGAVRATRIGSLIEYATP